MCSGIVWWSHIAHSAASLNSKSKNIPDEMMNTWEQVRILIIDEVSFSPEDQMEKVECSPESYSKETIRRQ